MTKVSKGLIVGGAKGTTRTRDKLEKGLEGMWVKEAGAGKPEASHTLNPK